MFRLHGLSEAKVNEKLTLICDLENECSKLRDEIPNFEGLVLFGSILKFMVKGFWGSKLFLRACEKISWHFGAQI